MLSVVAKRGLSTLIPPKIASAANIGSNPAAKRMQNIVGFYSKLPRGHAPAPTAKGLFARYREKYRGSGAPVFHATMALLVAGYSMDYYFELRHEKDE